LASRDVVGYDVPGDVVERLLTPGTSRGDANHGGELQFPVRLTHVVRDHDGVAGARQARGESHENEWPSLYRPFAHHFGRIHTHALHIDGRVAGERAVNYEVHDVLVIVRPRL